MHALRFTFALSAAAHCLLAVVLLTGAPSLAAPSGAVPVFVHKVALSDMQDRIEALGTLRANESVELTASVTDTVSALHFDDGDRVPAGKVLAEMTSGEERALLAEARIQVEEARRQYERTRQLHTQSSVSESLLDERKRQWEAGKARLKAIESRLADRLVRAPFDGIVGLRNVSVGSLVRPGDLITTLDDDRVMKLDFPVPAVFVGVLASGLELTATTPAWPGRAFDGTLKSIDSRIDRITRTLMVRALLDNPGGKLRPGMLMNVRLLAAERSAVVIPEESLVAKGTQHFVFVVDPDADNTVQRREVTIRARQPGRVEISTGLEVGELVVTDGALKLRPGSPVSIRAHDDGVTGLNRLLEQAPTGAGTP